VTPGGAKPGRSRICYSGLPFRHGTRAFPPDRGKEMRSLHFPLDSRTRFGKMERRPAPAMADAGNRRTGRLIGRRRPCYADALGRLAGRPFLKTGDPVAAARAWLRAHPD